MSGLILLPLAFLVAIVVTEVVLRGRKSQTAIFRMVAVHAVIGIGTIVTLGLRGDASPIASLIWWGGAFLAWFGIRSHIESSILLRLATYLRPGPMEFEQLADRYEAEQGVEARIEEMVAGGLVERTGREPVLTGRGRFIVSVSLLLRPHRSVAEPSAQGTPTETENVE